MNLRGVREFFGRLEGIGGGLEKDRDRDRERER